MKKIFAIVMNNKLVIRMMSLGDQVIFAGGNFMITILLTRFFKPSELAAYGMAISIALILQGTQRDSYIIQNALLPPNVLKGRARKILAEHIVAIFPLLVMLAIASFITTHFFPDTLTTMTLIATMACFSIFSQLEFERVILTKYKLYIIPVTTSCLYALLVGGLLFFHTHLTFNMVMISLTVFAFLKSLILIAVIGMPDFKGGWTLLRSDLRRNSTTSMLGVVGYSGYVHAPVIFLGLVSTPVEAAAYVAMRGLMQPLQIVIRSLDVIDKSFFRERSENSAHGTRKLMISQILFYGMIGIALSGLICALAPQMIHFFYGGKYGEFRDTLYFWGILTVFFAILQPIESVIILRKLLNKYNIVRLWIGIGTCIIVALAAEPYGARGATIISAAASIAGVLAGLALVLRTLKKNMERVEIPTPKFIGTGAVT
ncbi:MAG: hypothetical protein WBK77_07945 [Alphaproteobacteria bacterium]